MVNLKLEVEIEVLTPINIGAGSEKDLMKGVDFIEKDNKIYVLNLRKVASEGIDLRDLSTYFANKQDQEIARILGKKIEIVSDVIFSKPASATNDIKSFIKNELTGKPIIPGSSLKGAIRSILFKNLRKNETKPEYVFGTIKNGDDFMRFIKISDFGFETTELYNTKIFNLRKDSRSKSWEGGWKHRFNGDNSTTVSFNHNGFNTIFEAIAPNNKGYGTIMFAKTAFNNFGVIRQKYGDEKSQILDHRKLFEIINNHTKQYLKKESDFFSKYQQAENTDKIIDGINKLIQAIPVDNSYCIMKMAAGSGFHSITGDWQFDDFSINGIDNSKKISRGLLYGEKSAKSRKIVIHGDNLFSLMGFVKIRVITDEEKAWFEKEKENLKLQRERQEEKERLQRGELERRIKEYNDLVESAGLLLDLNQLEDALEKIKKAEELMPEGNKHSGIYNEINLKIEFVKDQEQKEIADKKAQEEAERNRKKRIEAGLAFLDEINETGNYKVTDFKGAKNRIEQWMKKANHEMLPDKEHERLLSFLQRIFKGIVKENERQEWKTFNKGVWVHVSNWIGQEKAFAFFNQIING